MYRMHPSFSLPLTTSCMRCPHLGTFFHSYNTFLILCSWTSGRVSCCSLLWMGNAHQVAISRAIRQSWGIFFKKLPNCQDRACEWLSDRLDWIGIITSQLWSMKIKCYKCWGTIRCSDAFCTPSCVFVRWIVFNCVMAFGCKHVVEYVMVKQSIFKPSIKSWKKVI